MREFAIELNHEKARLPSKGSEEAAGYDLHSVESWIIPPGTRAIVNIGIRSQIPKGFYGRIADRSGLAYVHGLTVLAGVIDSDYRGDWKVILLNTGDDSVCFDVGDRVAQVVLTKIANFPIVEVASVEDSDRGMGGFGSTGQ
jgi:dUTP pyrophosphatase